MNPWVITMVAGAGGLGAATRFILDGLVTSRVHTRIPLGTMVINVSGSFLLGLVTGVALSMAVPEQLRLILGTGFLAGYTTFSTASTQTADLIRQGHAFAAAANSVIMLTGALTAAAIGLWLGATG